ncbi:MAG: hypothetical protein IKJ04_08300, partial [Clostridia bacterium]|nr:hypothetical protein [Clostridia bacterium]
VTEFLINPQTLDLKYKSMGGLGLVAMFYVSEDGSKISVQYYSTIHDKFYGSKSQFTFECTVDKSGIDRNVEKVEKDHADSSKYTKESYDALTAVLKDADSIRNKVVTQAEVDAYVAKLEAAINGLVLISDGETTPETQPVPDETETEPLATESPNAEGGCGTMIAGAAIVVALLGSAIVFKKKD